MVTIYSYWTWLTSNSHAIANLWKLLIGISGGSFPTQGLNLKFQQQLVIV